MTLETRFDAILPTLATRSDVESLRTEMHKTDAETHRRIETLRTDLHKIHGEMQGAVGTLRSEMHELIGSSRSEMHELIGSLRSDTHKASIEMQRWMVATAIGIVVGLGALIINTSNGGRSAAPLTQQPIVITIPQQPSPQQSELPGKLKN